MPEAENDLPSTWVVRQVDQSPEITLEGFTMFRILDGSGFDRMGCEYVVLEPKRVLPAHVHEKSHSVILVLRGTGFALVNKRRYALTKDSVVNVPPGIAHGLEAGDEELVVYGFQYPAIIGEQNDADIYFVDDGRKGKISSP